MTIPMYDPAALYRAQKAEFDAAVLRVLESGRVDWGPEVPEFEAEFGAWLGAAYVVGVGSGSAALRAALRALGIGPGDEVITVANTDLGGSGAISMAGATIRWVDIDPVSRCIDPRAAEAAIGPRTRAILPVDMFGHPADMPALRSLAAEHGLALIQDSCLSPGAVVDGRTIGTLADVTCFSFSAGKHLGAFGSGGACATEDAALADRIRKLSSDGQDVAHHYTLPRPLALRHMTDGENARLHEIQAAILRVKLPRLSDSIALRRQQARQYRDLLSDLPIDLPGEKPGCVHAWRNFAVECDDRAALSAHLAAQGIGSNALYSPPMHLQPAYAHLGGKPGDLPVTERSCNRILNLPIGPHLPADAVETVARAVRTHFV